MSCLVLAAGRSSGAEDLGEIVLLFLLGDVAVVLILFFYLFTDYLSCECKRTLWFWKQNENTRPLFRGLFWIFHLLQKGFKGPVKISYHLFLFYKTHGQNCALEVL